jgi:hypothetical protein
VLQKQDIQTFVEWIRLDKWKVVQFVVTKLAVPYKELQWKNEKKSHLLREYI